MIPHLRDSIVLHVERPLLSLCHLEQPLDFGALDEQPVFCLFTMVSPTVHAHLYMLLRLSFALRDPQFQQAICQQVASEAPFSELRRNDASLRRLPSPVPGESADLVMSLFLTASGILFLQWTGRTGDGAQHAVAELAWNGQRGARRGKGVAAIGVESFMQPVLGGVGRPHDDFSFWWSSRSPRWRRFAAPEGRSQVIFLVEPLSFCYKRRVKAKIIVMPKKTVLDPQGKTVKRALESLGFDGIRDVRIGKFIEVELEGGDLTDLKRKMEHACHKLLSNPVIEEYHIEM